MRKEEGGETGFHRVLRRRRLCRSLAIAESCLARRGTDPYASTTFPQQMVVDYVRAYRDP